MNSKFIRKLEAYGKYFNACFGIKFLLFTFFILRVGDEDRGNFMWNMGLENTLICERLLLKARLCMIETNATKDTSALEGA